MEKRRDTIELTTFDDLKTPHQATLASLYDGYYDRIYAYCVHRLFCRTAAEDVTGRIFLAAARGIGAVADSEPAAHGRWLYAIATNQCNAYIRKHLRRRKIFAKFQLEHRHHQETQDLPPDWTAVYAAMAQLKDIEQTVITLRFLKTWTMSKLPPSSTNGKRRCG